ncbi:isoprenylcysteine carboxyl methyltransferase family protein [Evansella sp. AB-rgal1]|uniref:isoprenylcysteine carboxyl methyltransferase family protein n=1 Tax=Evansella sp. AB-rgal1 TaxID=3242696 RepID=UPI00359E586C
MMFFWILIGFIIMQRLGELVVARKNEQWMLAQGGKEYGEKHYPFIVLLHSGFFFALILEVLLKGRGLIYYWPLLLAVFLFVQLTRVWVIQSLGRFWNTKIIILPGEDLVRKGPYQWVKHPNYLIVAAEFIVVPLLFQAYTTLIVFSVLNALFLLFIRIPKEEEALKLV